jgi:hypothetical protein
MYLVLGKKILSKYKLREISGSHSCKYEDGCLLGYCVM